MSRASERCNEILDMNLACHSSTERYAAAWKRLAAGAEENDVSVVFLWAEDPTLDEELSELLSELSPVHSEHEWAEHYERQIRGEIADALGLAAWSAGAVKACACGNSYDARAWLGLKRVGGQRVFDVWAELRNCTCGSSILGPQGAVMAVAMKPAVAS